MNHQNNKGWQTTTSYTFRPPKQVPGYTGYIPQLRYGYGDTFGNMTEQSFHAQRNHSLFSSTNQTKKGYTCGEKAFPTVYSNNPALVLADRKRCRERWLAHQKYARFIEGTREDDLNNFLQSCQKHRHHYTDQTGTIQRIDVFLLPKLSVDIPINKKPCHVMKEERIFLPPQAQHHHHGNNKTNFRGNLRERAVRDQFFENR